MVIGDTPYEFQIQDKNWLDYAARPGAVTMMDPQNKARVDAAVAKAPPVLPGLPHGK